MIQAVIAALQSGDVTDGDVTLQAAGDLLAEAERLKAAVVEAIAREQAPPRLAELIWALSKSGDARYKGVYVEHLRRSAQAYPPVNLVIYQALIALDNIGEEVFERDANGRSSQSVADAERNIRQARAYLAGCDVRRP
jgi:hypothetical protein